MAALVALGAFNALVLLAPPGAVGQVLELMPLPSEARGALLCAVAVNVCGSLAFERWGVEWVAEGVGMLLQHGRRRRGRDGRGHRAAAGATHGVV